MKLFFGKHYGKDIEELPSGYLIWLLEECEHTDWLISNACKKELSERFKIDFIPNKPESETLTLQLNLANSRILFLEKLICMSIISKGNPLLLDSYLNNPKLLESHLKLIRLVNE